MMGEYVMTFVDQAGVIRSVYVKQAFDREDAIVKGRAKLTKAIQQLVPANVNFLSHLSLELMGIEKGSMSCEGWVPAPREEA